MSRNLRHHRAKGTVPAKHSARRPSTTENSSDDDYAGVDLISDSEEDEPDVEVAEEQAIIQSAEESDADDDDAHNATRPHEDDDASSWNGFDDAIDVGEAFFEDHIARGYVPDTMTDVATFNALQGGCSDDEPTRRVRFDVVEESDSEDEDDMFPDIFLAQNDLDPNFRKAIESNEGNDDHIGSSDDGSYWDYHEDERRIGELEKAEEHSQSASETSSSTNYETDEGETTEEDLPNAAKFVPACTVLRPSTPDSDASESASEAEEVPVRRSYKIRGPRLGSWVHDRNRPFVAFDKSGKKLLVFNARRFSEPNTTHTSPLMESDTELHAIDQSPMISNSGNLMMSAMYGHNSNFMGALGPPEAFVPFTSIGADGTIYQDSLSSYDEEDLSDDDMLNVNDFLNFGEDSSDSSDDDGSPGDSDPMGGKQPTTPGRGKATSEGQVHPLLDHFNNGIVGAFRHNQNRHKLISRNAATQESLAFSGPFGHGAIRGFKANRLGAANTPITPNRKQNFGVLLSSPISRLAVKEEEGSPLKRKISQEVYAHKRRRSAY